jgi:hypothetical protein
VAMAFHAREHRRSSSTRYVLAQGTARVIEQPSDQQRALVRANAASFPRKAQAWSDVGLLDARVLRDPRPGGGGRDPHLRVADTRCRRRSGPGERRDACARLRIRCSATRDPMAHRWLCRSGSAVYAPHTETGYRTPANKTGQMLITAPSLSRGSARCERRTGERRRVGGGGWRRRGGVGVAGVPAFLSTGTPRNVKISGAPGFA